MNVNLNLDLIVAKNVKQVRISKVEVKINATNALPGVIAPQISSFLALLELSMSFQVNTSKVHVKNVLQEHTAAREWKIAYHALFDSLVTLVVLIAHFVILASIWMILRLMYLLYLRTPQNIVSHAHQTGTVHQIQTSKR